jgi:hypothetical protein
MLEQIPEYAAMDIGAPFRRIIGESPPSTPFMISESELLSTNPSFPKELLVTGTDLVLLHEAAVASSLDNPSFAHIVSSLGAAPERIGREMGQHFRIVITRPKLLRAGSVNRPVSLFAIQANLSDVAAAGDAYAGLFCDIVSALPTAEQFGATSVFELIESLSRVAPLFLDDRTAIQAEAVLWYARVIVESEASLVSRFCAVVDARDLWTLRATDRTCSLRSQHTRLSSALELIKATRANLQSHLNLELTEELTKERLSVAMKEAMFHSHEFVSDVDVFQNLVFKIANRARAIVDGLGVAANSAQICRVLFFRLTAHVTFRRFLQTDEVLWKYSIIIGKIIENNRAAITASLRSTRGEEFKTRLSYFQRATDMLGHIKTNSGLSVIVYYVLEVVGIVHTLCSQCRELNFDECLLWVIVSAEMKHVFPISHYLQHFILNRGQFLDMMFEREEISLLGVFPSAIRLLLTTCKAFDKRVDEKWAASAGKRTAAPAESGQHRKHGALILK